GAIRLAGGRRTRRRDRCATAFSRQAHLGLSGRPYLAVRLKAVRLLPRPDRLHRAGADLPINVGADNLLHGGMVKVALRLETVTGRAVYEMPVFAVPLTLGPVPAIGPALTLHPFLDRAMMNVDSKSVTVIRQAGSRGVRATGLLHPPHTLKDTVRRLRLALVAGLSVVLFQHRHLVVVRPVGGPDLKVSASVRDSSGHGAGEGVRRVATQVLNLPLIGPAGGQRFQRRLRELAIRGHGASSVKVFSGTEGPRPNRPRPLLGNAGGVRPRAQPQEPRRERRARPTAPQWGSRQRQGHRQRRDRP